MLLLALPLLVLAPEPSPNEVSAHMTFPFPRWGVAVGYRRALGRRVSASGLFETIVPARGFLHLPGFEEQLGVDLWFRRVGEGIYMSPTASMAHNVFYRLPEQARHAFRIGAELGWRYLATERLSVGAAASGQWGWSVGREGSVCTYDYQCPSSTPGGVVKARLTIGVRW